MLTFNLIVNGLSFSPNERVGHGRKTDYFNRHKAVSLKTAESLSNDDRNPEDNTKLVVKNEFRFYLFNALVSELAQV